MPDLGSGRSGILEDDEAKSSDIGSGLRSVSGSDSGLVEVSGLDQAWYAPFQDSLIWMMDGVHDLTGLPWWLVISASTLAFRVSLYPVLIFQLKKMERIVELMPKLPPPLPPPLSGRSFREQYSLFQKKRQEIGCPSYLWSFTFFIIQFPCFLLGMTSIRRMCLDCHPGLDTGGALWFQNLTDFPQGLLGPTFPILIAGLHYVNVQISFRNFEAAQLPGILGLLAKYYKLYLDILSFPLLAIGFFIPQGNLVYWATNSSLTLIQQLSLKNPHIRNMLGLAPEKILKKRISIENVTLENNDTLQHEIPAQTLSPEKLLDISLEYLVTGHQDKALPLLRVATEKDPELVRALVAMGQILCSKESFEEAAEYFERAISKIHLEEENSLLVLACFGAGVSHIWQGKKPEGIQHLKRIAELKVPDNPMDKACYYKGLVMLGSILFGDGEKSEAAKYLRIAAAYDPGVNAYLKECEEG